jgi:SAM-dependent methyltransferase
MKKGITMSLKGLIKKAVPGVLWQNPVVWMGLRALDPLDHAVRSTRGFSHLPPFSVRVRSNGITKQFGGRNFDHYGRILAGLLQDNAALVSTSDVLEIGCGCGRTALALARILENGHYTGIDIERVSLEACRKNPLLRQKEFRFDLLDVQNNEYNP